jgi:ectoine hydroxylase-related dioxygenase (phytanoyl-CoA dioxygenase family)
MTQIDQPFVIANGREPAELRALMAENGYLFFKDFGPKDAIRALRRDILTVCAEAGWLDPEADLMDGIWGGAGPHTEGHPEYMAVYRKVIHLDRFKSLPQHPIFMQLAEIMTGAPALVHRRHIGRMTFPQNTGQTIMAHQDWYYIRGTPETYTMWLPLGDCPLELGGLAMLAGSHQHGFIDHRRLPERNVPFALEADQWPSGLEWHASDFELGDVVMFHAYTIHRALPNQTADRLRLSIDNRYQRDGEAIEPGSMQTHYNL